MRATVAIKTVATQTPLVITRTAARMATISTIVAIAVTPEVIGDK